MKDLRLFIDEYKNYLSKFILKGGQDDVLFEAYQNLIKLLDESLAQAANLLDIHNQVLKEVLNIRNDNDVVQWIYIERATEFLAQILIATDALLLSLKESVEKDPLTGLYNRLAIEKMLSKVWSTAQTTKTPFTLAMVDLDNFKSINDSYGHIVGDEILKEVSSIIKKSLREEDVVMRYGGEEFVILLPGTDGSSALNPLERIRRRIENAELSEFKLKITVSIGGAVYPDDRPLEPDELIKFADAAMYEAKKEGKNRIVFYSQIKN
ncbi:GGDEF domain-containing protein [Caldicoprobacter algeriensis]|uniref:GGDEF domain-containing protein n=1 Tax=Caldicoprobacter algeriensis TaxID=699281 RepID=UPI00207B017D|nr:GGDEF domain-containing protein [Caldicoprobacter algeriensis]MCM8900741.1 GGDEF domain-containing protein [Caldicoprobacter algeriensis]